MVEEAHPDEEVDHEEDVEGEVYLLRGVGGPGHAGLHGVTGIQDYYEWERLLQSATLSKISGLLCIIGSANG